MQKSLLFEALELVTCHWGGWVSKEDVTISKQTFRAVLYSLRFSSVGLLIPPPACLRILRLPPGEGYKIISNKGWPQEKKSSEIPL